MKPILITMNTYQTVSEDEIAPSLLASDSHRGGGTVWCIGNGQVHDALQMEIEKCKTLNCMVDPMKILIARNDEG